MPPELCNALVVAQDAVGTAPSNGYNSNQKYNYPTLDDIVRTAKEALRVAKIGVEFEELGLSEVVGKLAVSGRYRVTGLGKFGPWRNCVMFMGRNPDAGKALAGAKSLLRKYALGDLLNMSWSDPSEDQDSDKFGGNSGGSQHKGVNGQSGGHQKPAAKTAKPVNPAEKLRNDANAWRQYLIKEGCDSEMVFNFALGIDGVPRKPAPQSMLRALCEAGKAVHAVGKDGSRIGTHDELLTFLEATGSPVLWSHGKITAAGESFDKSSANGR
jgi:hypothetical protein